MLNIESVAWKIQHFSRDEDEQQGLVDAIRLLAVSVAIERPDLADGLIASANYADGITNKKSE